MKIKIKEILFFILHNAFTHTTIEITHPVLTEEAAKLYNLYFDDKLSAREMGWLKEGSIGEDIAHSISSRCVRHFYDPVYKTGLYGNFSAKEWLHDSRRQLIDGGDYTWERAIREYNKGNKERAYQALGHVLHLIQDMSAPAHTRGDSHLMRDPMEEWAGKYLQENLRPNFKNLKPVIYGDIDTYFEELAQYSNNNFFSRGTINKGKYSLPKINFNKKEIRALKNGRKEYYVYNELGARLALVEETFFGKKYSLDDSIHRDYFNLLISKAIEFGAGAIKLFHDNVKRV